MCIVYVGIDLAKNLFAVHGVDEAGEPALVRPSMTRARLREQIASLPLCTVAMQACSGGLAGHGVAALRLLGPSKSALADSEPRGSVPLRPLSRGPRPHRAVDDPQAGHPLPHERQNAPRTTRPAPQPSAKLCNASEFDNG